DQLTGPGEDRVLVDPMDSTRRKTISPDASFEDLLVPVFRGGRVVYESPPLEGIRGRTREQLARVHGGIKRFVNPHGYPVGLEPELLKLKTRLILEARQKR
ncbi:MAG: nicotinate phosphoribosyltransferase, partial [Acidobacteria bacterium]|nr:nicotinate phosphoribosyltransferase [Acidobacteriota bacterium]NIO59881.1 nicotinate phosphoribosyltransferase [Acidobacteriota bacterium]NIQ30966.1 nicotinate phosphoribosyltransferase [Acidobacteriota bacterium]NIQ86048.1 nicotinate phosphoribosyltransferase [Acidobacteriota bacterium]